jgi:tellurite resistance protein
MQAPDLSAPQLARLPVALFAAVLGTAGWAGAWRVAERGWGWPAVVSPVLTGLATLVFIALVLAYAAKCLRHPQAVAAEFKAVVSVTFFPTISIGGNLVAALWAHSSIPGVPAVAEALWLACAVLQAGLFVAVVWRWSRSAGLKDVTPAWFIPPVGLITMPLGGVPVGWVGLSWAFFIGGAALWLVLLSLVLLRLARHGLLPLPATPSYFILIAPPSVGYISWWLLHGGALAPGWLALAGAACMGVAGAMAALLLGLLWRAGQANAWFKGLGFHVGFWATTFPMAALSRASTLHFGPSALALAVFVAMNLVIGGVAVMSALRLARGRLF